jgi:hypothetical protein
VAGAPRANQARLRRTVRRLFRVVDVASGPLLTVLFVLVAGGQFVPVLRAGLLVVPSVQRERVVHAGALVRSTFVVRNIHTLWPVTVTGLQGDCGCTRGFVGRRLPFTLAPLGSASLDVAVPAPNREGPMKHSVTVMTSTGHDNTPAVVDATIIDASKEVK